MNPEDDNARSGDSKSGGRPSRSLNVARAAHPERSAPSTSSVRDTSAAPSASRGRTAPTLKPTAQPAIPSQREKKAIQKRAEGRAKLPPKFRDGLKRFLFSPTRILKIIRLGLLIGALVCFIIAEAQESYIAITVLETCIVLFFILIYMLTLHHSMTYLHWPLLDLINSFITAVFLFVVAVLAMEEKERSHLFYVGGSLCLTAAIVCLIDATVVTKTMRNTMKKALGIETKTGASPTQEPISPTRVPPRGSPRAPTRATMKQRGLSEPPSEAPSRAPSRAPSQAPSSSPSRR
ncbi:LOW QUALITY PROTEIN: CKLF-like MARVEL transmembrane domain-containing protein 2B [Sagmatias obliquidens]|uniref:LOW QUALITY PROTEIN: CKLF-like MARVEL transmembrane domain-containing protein 2B n=1 Tax=Sagmatias obliquidens TaxID=3371155 RepID=UPI000F43F5AC|nr:LOW QUALITY PROTEIN: CKLF-like MARVEL transmembrane domain-containing protein 2B [Lagenorhynchus obliquidens]